MGKSGARSAGPAGCLVNGWSTGGRGWGRSAWMLYHLLGISFCDRLMCVSMVISPLSSHRRMSIRSMIVAGILHRALHR